MVIGMDAFKEAFKGYEDCYTIIGGTACDITTDIKKHKNDVFRLMNVINPDETITTSKIIKEDIRQFISKMSGERINMKNIGVNMELDVALQILENIYLIN